MGMKALRLRMRQKGLRAGASGLASSERMASRMPKSSWDWAVLCFQFRSFRAAAVVGPMAMIRSGLGAVQAWTDEGEVKHTTSALGGDELFFSGA
jgi:hypothetical protein